MMDARELYQELILDHGRRPRNFKVPEHANHSAEGKNPLCGDHVIVRLEYENGLVKDIGFQGSGCAISTAAASTMTEVVKGKTRAEVDAIVFEATTDHGRLAGFGLDILPAPDDRPVRILTHCNTGPLACGQYGTALGVVQAAHHADRPVHVWVDETRPYLQGARLTTWELAQAGVPHTLLPDMAAGHLMALGEVDVVLVGGDRVAANGDTAYKVGTYTLAVLAARHGIPFYVCAPTSSVDLETADGSAIPIEETVPGESRPLRAVLRAGSEDLGVLFGRLPATRRWERGARAPSNQSRGRHLTHCQKTG